MENCKNMEQEQLQEHEQKKKVQECLTSWSGGIEEWGGDLHHISKAGLLLGWVDSESFNELEQEREQ